MDLAERIRHEGESTTLDFKMSLYPQAKKADLISDVMAMANAATKDDRFIVFGVKHAPDGTKTFHSLNAIPDSSEIEQLMLQNIEPSVHVEFAPFEYEGHQLAFLRIFGCVDQPYLMRKDFSPLTKGTGKIRKGTTTFPLLRNDFDRIYEAKSQAPDLRKFIKVTWDCDPPSKELQISRPQGFRLPSMEQSDLIQGHINNLERAEYERKNPTAKQVGTTHPAQALDGILKYNAEMKSVSEAMKGMALFSGFGPLGYGTPCDPYERMTLDELKEKLVRVGFDYREDDEYYAFMEMGAALNLKIMNEGPEYLDDAVVNLTFQKNAGLSVAKEPPRKPNRSRSPFELQMQDFSHQIHNQLVYPAVQVYGDEITVKASVKHLKNHMATVAFGKSLRVAIAANCSAAPIPVRFKLIARGLQAPLEDLLFILPIP